jgi:hypothetical protein
MLNARPTHDQAIKYELGASQVSDNGRRQIHCGQAPIGIDRNMSGAFADLLVGVISTFMPSWCFDRLAIDDAG